MRTRDDAEVEFSVPGAAGPFTRLRFLPVSRRAALRAGLSGVAGTWLATGVEAPALCAEPSVKARAVIQIWMWGGPSHLDTFDPKPDAGFDYCGPLARPLTTSVDGISIGELLPRLAKQADKYAIIRSMTHGVNAHETASYIVQTGRTSGDGLVHPSAGAVVSLLYGYEAGYEGLIPPYIVLTQPQGRFSEAGFLGSRYKPFATGGDPNQKRFAVEGVVAEGISDSRQRSRRGLLDELDTLGREMGGHPRIEEFERCEEQAYDLILGDAGKVFELGEEPDALRERYGRSTFGQSCLMARRLVESGVRYVTINYKGWDTHKQHFEIMRRKLPEMDGAVATLLEDLTDRGLLASTIVWWGGEFGRTPRVDWQAPWNGGRGHHGHVFSTVVAGGGFRGGRIVGASDAKGETVNDRPVHPRDLVATVYRLLGIDPAATLRNPQGLEVPVTPLAPDGSQPGECLAEIL